MPTFRLTLSYDGTDFAGSQVQPGQRTVQGELERVLSRLEPDARRTIFAGRTDRGVHAAGQVVAACLPAWRASPNDLGRALDARLPADIVNVGLSPCSSSFNPRFEAIWREYRYWIAPGVLSPFLRRYAWTPRTPVSTDAVAAAARNLVGIHDFASFAGGGEGVPWSERSRRRTGTTRHVFRCECRAIEVNAGPVAEQAVRVLEIRVAANGFLPRMVRNIVGALVEVGQGRQEPPWIGEILAAKDRRAGSVVAPAQGLTLWRVGFAGDELEDW